jgi:nucleoside-diphosphate-sugar epimerase
MASSVLVTGANGFIGSHLCDAFLAAGFEVHGLVRPGSDLRFLSDPRVRLLRGDLTSTPEIPFPSSLDVIVHAAAFALDTASREEARTHILGITSALVEEAARRYPRLRRFVYISSALTLGYCADGISEKSPGRSAAYLPYGRMKIETEKFLFARHRETGFPVVILRPGDVYGPRDRTSCKRMLDATRMGIPIRIGTGMHRFGLCSPANLCQAALAAVQRAGAVGKAYTVANAVSPTWREFFDALQRGIGRPQRVYVPASLVFAIALLGELARRVVPFIRPQITWYRIRRITSQTTYDISATVADLGYAPDNEYRRLFQEIVDWYSTTHGRTAR